MKSRILKRFAVIVAVTALLVRAVTYAREPQVPSTSAGGSFLPNFDTVVLGQWTFTHASAPLVLYNLTGYLKANGSSAVTASTTIATSGGITTTSPTLGVGYAIGSGCAVTQATDRTTGVICTGTSGAITTNAASLGAELSANFVVTNTSVAVGDVVVVGQRSGSNGGNTDVLVTVTAAGSFTIKVANNNAAAGTAETGAIIINFAVIKAVST